MDGCELEAEIKYGEVSLMIQSTGLRQAITLLNCTGRKIYEPVLKVFGICKEL